MRRGFTLLEILIAMAVFLIGMVSILAVFPVGIRSSTLSTNQSVASALAESMDDALTLALRQFDGSVTSDVYFHHDGLGASGQDWFRLPILETWVSGGTTFNANGRSKPTWYPREAAAGPYPVEPPAKLASLGAGQSGDAGADLSAIVGGSLTNKDYPDPLSQYSFRFMCHEYKNPNDAETTDEHPRNPQIGGPPLVDQYLWQNGAQAEVVDKLYTFTLTVYRGWKAVTCTDTTFQIWDDPTTTTIAYTWRNQREHPQQIGTFEFNIYSPGAR